MRGTLDRPSIDYGGAAGRLAAMLLRQQYLVEQQQLAQQQQLDKAASSKGGGGDHAAMQSSFLGHWLGKAVRALVVPSREGVAEIEAMMKRDMTNVPKHWDLG